MKLTRRTVIYIFFSILFLVVAGNFFRMMSQQGVVLTWLEGEETFLEVADSPEERMLGLFSLNELPRDRGMIFLFEEGEPMQIWTRQYKFPVDLVWLDGDFRVVRLLENISPCLQDPCTTYGPGNPDARYALALAAGQIAQHGLKKGDPLNLSRKES